MCSPRWRAVRSFFVSGGLLLLRHGGLHAASQASGAAARMQNTGEIN